MLDVFVSLTEKDQDGCSDRCDGRGEAEEEEEEQEEEDEGNRTGRGEEHEEGEDVQGLW